MTRTLPAHVRTTATAIGDTEHAVLTVRLVEKGGDGRPRRFSWTPDANSVAKFWTPVIGPSCVAIGRAAVVYVDRTFTVREFAYGVGLKVPLFLRSCDRLNRFGLGGLVHVDEGRWELRVDTPWPYLTRYQVDHLPTFLRDDYLRVVVR